MIAQPDSPVSESTVEEVLREELASGDSVLGAIAPILGHLVASADGSLFNDQVVASIRGRADHVAIQLLRAQAVAANESEPEDFVEAGRNGLASELMAEQHFLLHCHALTIEAQAARLLQRRSGVDPVVSPMLQVLIASPDQAIAGGAMAILAAQARFFQHHDRMELPLRELPGDLFDKVVFCWRSFSGPGTEELTAQAEMYLRGSFDEGAGRLGLLNRMIATLGRDAKAALSISHGGMALFATALAVASDQPRPTAVLSTSEQQMGRLALSLRAAGLDIDAVTEQFHFLHPDIALPEGFEGLRIDRAQALIAAARPQNRS